jgi:hypothetical protein
MFMCSDGRYVPPCPAFNYAIYLFVALVFQPWTLRSLDKCSATWSTPPVLFVFRLFFKIFLLLCWVGIHCGIYKSSYNVSNILYLNSPLPPLSFIPSSPIPGIVSTGYFLDKFSRFCLGPVLDHNRLTYCFLCSWDHRHILPCLTNIGSH